MSLLQEQDKKKGHGEHGAESIHKICRLLQDTSHDKSAEYAKKEHY